MKAGSRNLSIKMKACSRNLKKLTSIKQKDVESFKNC